MSRLLYVCGGRYLGFRDDVPEECRGCERLQTMEEHICRHYMMLCQMKPKPTPERTHHDRTTG